MFLDFLITVLLMFSAVSSDSLERLKNQKVDFLTHFFFNVNNNCYFLEFLYRSLDWTTFCLHQFLIDKNLCCQNFSKRNTIIYINNILLLLMINKIKYT